MATTTDELRTEVHRIVDDLPDGAGWDELLYRLHIRQQVEAGREDSLAGRTVTHEEILREFGIGP